MFDVGFSELLVIAVIALLVLGPERLPKAARFAGLWVRRARAQWNSVKSEFERDLADDDLKRSLRETRESLRDAQDSLRNVGSRLRRDFESTGEDVMRGPSLPSAAGIAAPASLDRAQHSGDPTSEPAITRDLFDPDREDEVDMDRHDPEMDEMFERERLEDELYEAEQSGAERSGVNPGDDELGDVDLEPPLHHPMRPEPSDAEDDPGR